jgi:hypothetical protein
MASVHHQRSLSLGIIGLMEVIPAVSMALFAGHIVDQRKKLISQMHFGFSVISFGLFFIDMAGGRALLATNDFIFYLLLSFSWGLVRAFLGPTITIILTRS